MDENINIEELNSIELMKLILKEVKDTRIELNEKIDRVYKELDEKIDRVYKELNEKIDKKIDEVYKELNNKIEEVYKELDKKIDEVYKELNNKIDEVYKELDNKIEEVYKELNEKIDNTRKILIAEVSEELKVVSITTSGLINSLENKIDDEINDRKIDISKVKDFNKIILNDFGSRISILEEEGEKYNIKED